VLFARCRPRWRSLHATTHLPWRLPRTCSRALESAFSRAPRRRCAISCAKNRMISLKAGLLPHHPLLATSQILSRRTAQARTINSATRKLHRRSSTRRTTREPKALHRRRLLQMLRGPKLHLRQARMDNLPGFLLRALLFKAVGQPTRPNLSLAKHQHRQRRQVPLNKPRQVLLIPAPTGSHRLSARPRRRLG